MLKGVSSIAQWLTVLVKRYTSGSCRYTQFLGVTCVNFLTRKSNLRNTSETKMKQNEIDAEGSDLNVMNEY